MPLDTPASRSDGLEDFPLRFDDAWTSHDPADLDALRVALPAVGLRQDDNGAFFARALDYVKARTYTRLLPPLAGRRLVPTVTETPPGAASVTYTIYDQVGMARIVANYADDLPRADVRGMQRSAVVQTVGDSYGYSTQDLRASQMTGMGLPARKADAARNAVERKVNSLMFFGDTAHQMFGVGNHPNIPVVVAPTGNWATATGDQIVDDVNALYNAIVNQSNGVHTPNVLALPNQARAAMFTKRTSGAAQVTAGVFIQAQFPDLEIMTAQELRVGSTNTAFMGERSADNYYHEEVMPFTQLPPQARNLELVVPCEARTAGLIVVRPLATARMTGI